MARASDGATATPVCACATAASNSAAHGRRAPRPCSVSHARTAPGHRDRRDAAHGHRGTERVRVGAGGRRAAAVDRGDPPARRVHERHHVAADRVHVRVDDRDRRRRGQRRVDRVAAGAQRVGARLGGQRVRRGDRAGGHPTRSGFMRANTSLASSPAWARRRRSDRPGMDTVTRAMRSALNATSCARADRPPGARVAVGVVVADVADVVRLEAGDRVELLVGLGLLVEVAPRRVGRAVEDHADVGLALGVAADRQVQRVAAMGLRPAHADDALHVGHRAAARRPSRPRRPGRRGCGRARAPRRRRRSATSAERSARRPARRRRRTHRPSRRRRRPGTSNANRDITSWCHRVGRFGVHVDATPWRRDRTPRSSRGGFPPMFGGNPPRRRRAVARRGHRGGLTTRLGGNPPARPARPGAGRAGGQAARSSRGTARRMRSSEVGDLLVGRELRARSQAWMQSVTRSVRASACARRFQATALSRVQPRGLLAGRHLAADVAGQLAGRARGRAAPRRSGASSRALLQRGDRRRRGRPGAGAAGRRAPTPRRRPGPRSTARSAASAARSIAPMSS